VGLQEKGGHAERSRGISPREINYFGTRDASAALGMTAF
jgi:hypothetical protein